MAKRDFINEIKGLSEEQLRAKERSLSEQIMRDRISQVTDPSRDPRNRRQAKKELAQVLTLKSLLRGATAV